MRQVQSSNSLHVIRPGKGVQQRNSDGGMDIVGGDKDSEGEDGDGMGLIDSMTSIAKCGSTLELHTPKEGFSAVPFLMEMLGVYDVPSGDQDADVDMDMTDNNNRDDESIISSLFTDIPISLAQCTQAWTDICAFIHPKTKTCWRPSPKSKVTVWKRIVEGAVLQGINLETQFLVNDLWKSVLDDNGEEPFPRGLFEGVVRRVCEGETTSIQSIAKCELPFISGVKLRGGKLMKQGRASTNPVAYNSSAKHTSKPWLLLHPQPSDVVSSSMRGRITSQRLGGARLRFPSCLYVYISPNFDDLVANLTRMARIHSSIRLQFAS